ncbi:MAG: diaminopimelate decarboxylase [Caulobacteraceae bacterium]|nr:diaminopimelate decarboxylase [Caulobacter sp.]
MEAGVRRASGGALVSDGVALADIAREAGTPVYVHSAGALRSNYARFENAFTGEAPLIAYAVKANGGLAVLRVLAALGSGADTVSEGEVRRALAAGVAPERVVFSGVGKTDAELSFALEAEVGCLNVESEPELERLSAIAAAQGRVARVALRINPGVGAGGHSKITTGLAASKFGVAMSDARRLYARAAADPWLQAIGLACHIGSQITDLAPLEAAWTALRDLALALRAEGLAVRRLDLGGGLGADYGDGHPPPGPEAFAALAARVFADVDAEFAFEPGRVIAASAGVLLARVTHVNLRPDGRRFLVLDAGMNDLARPALYDAFHAVEPVAPPRAGALLPYDVVGPVCESSDVFALQRRLPPLEAGDVVAFMAAGAYGSAMAGEYNSRPLVPEAITDAGRWAVTRPRPSYADMLASERIPDWAP